MILLQSPWTLAFLPISGPIPPRHSSFGLVCLTLFIALWMARADVRFGFLATRNDCHRDRLNNQFDYLTSCFASRESKMLDLDASRRCRVDSKRDLIRECLLSSSCYLLLCMHWFQIPDLAAAGYLDRHHILRGRSLAYSIFD